MYTTELIAWLSGFVHTQSALSPQQQRIIANHIELCYTVTEGEVTPAIVALKMLPSASFATLRRIVLCEYRKLPCPGPREVIYFVQGVFEIGGIQCLNKMQAWVILDELERNVHGMHPCLIELCDKLLGFVNNNTDEHEFIDLKETIQAVNAVFQHDIDNTYTGDPQVLQAIHDGEI
jgi:hypothetical protein